MRMKNIKKWKNSTCWLIWVVKYPYVPSCLPCPHLCPLPMSPLMSPHVPSCVPSYVTSYVCHVPPISPPIPPLWLVKHPINQPIKSGVQPNLICLFMLTTITNHIAVLQKSNLHKILIFFPTTLLSFAMAPKNRWNSWLLTSHQKWSSEKEDLP